MDHRPQPPAVRTEFDAYCAGLELPEYAVGFESSQSYPLVRYAKGVNVVSGRKPAKYTGWHIQTGQSAELDALFEMQEVPCVRVRHLSENEETYWQFDSLDGYLLMKSVPVEYGPDSWKQSGVPYVWNNHKGGYMYGSQLQALFFLKGLLDLGYEQPLTLTLSRTVTEHFVSRVLRRQEALLGAIKGALRKHGKDIRLASYAYWMTLVRDEEEVTVGKGSSYYPPATMIELTSEYVRSHQTDPAHLAIIEAFVPAWESWAESASKQLMEPPRELRSEGGEEEQGTTEEAKATTPAKTAKSHDAKPDYHHNPDPTIIIDKRANGSSEALYNAAWQSKRRLEKAGAGDDIWQSLLFDLAIAKIADGRDIGKINAAVTEWLKDTQAAEKGEGEL